MKWNLTSSSEIDVRPPGMGGENEKAPFIEINPNAKVPVLLDGDLTLFESNAIMGHLAEKYGPTPLWSQDVDERAQIRQWQFWQGAHLSAAADGLLYENMVKPMMNQSPDETAVAEHVQSFHRWARVMERTLDTAEYLVGNRITCADLSVVTALMYAIPAEIPIAEHKSVQAWISRLQARPSWKATSPPPMGG